MTLYILNYNNYYNRLVKTEPSLEDYQEYIIFEHISSNFNPNDGIETQHIIGVGDYDGKGDYLIAANSDDIVSRWFIIEAKRTRAGQWQITLHRDVIADYYNLIMESPMYIEKGYVGSDSPFVFNSENVTLNQIKKGEYLLKNELETPWLVAYLSRFKTADDGESKVYNSFDGEFKLEPQEPDIEYESLEEYPFYKYTKQNPYIYTDDIQFGMYFRASADGYGSDAEVRQFCITKSGYNRNFTGIYGGSYPFCNTRIPEFDSEELREAAYNRLYQQYLTYEEIDTDSGLPVNTYTNIGTFEGYKSLKNEAGKVIKVGDDYYSVLVNSSTSIYSTNVKTVLKNNAGTFGNVVYNELTNGTGNWTTPISNPNINPFIIKPFQNPGAYIELKKLDNGLVRYNFTYSHNITRQTPYEIIAAPLNDMELTHNVLSGGQVSTQTVAHNGNIALQWFLDLGEKHAAGAVYDIQIVPYCPIYSTDLTNFETIGCYLEGTPDTPVALAVKIPQASFTRTYSTPADLPIDLDYKVSVNCDLYRICSPNGVGDFDFSIAKNNGMSGYEVDCTLIPYNPYIKVNPVFNTTGLYGGDYNDYRGLICKGDFSLPITTNQWETYELNNKNYQAIFDRETTTLEMQNKWARGEAWANVFTGTLAGTASGALAGSMVQPGIGTAVGAVAGGVASVGGGVLDLIKTYKLQDEQLAARHDLFQLNLQTIRARPNTLSRTTVYNINNKYFPYIEYYSCTDQEREAFKNKIKYDGMTIGAIGYIQNYLNGTDRTFIKARVIRLPETVGEDYHVGQQIASELNQGVYI